MKAKGLDERHAGPLGSFFPGTSARWMLSVESPNVLMLPLAMCGIFFFAMPSSRALGQSQDKDKDKESAKENDAPVGKELQAKTEGGPKPLEKRSLAEAGAILPLVVMKKGVGLIEDLWLPDKRGNACEAEKVSLNIRKGEADGEDRQGGPVDSIEGLGIRLVGGKHRATYVTCEGAWLLGTRKKDATEVVAYNGSAGALKISFAYVFGETFLWLETPAQVLRPGWQSIRFLQGTNELKGESTDWKPTGSLAGREECRALTMVIHNAGRKGMVFVAAIRVDLKDDSEKK